MSEDLWMVEAIIQPFKLEPVTVALAQVPGFVGVTVTDCRGLGQGRIDPIVGQSVTDHEPAGSSSAHPARRASDVDLDNFAPKVKLEIAVSGRALADAVVDTISRTAHTGRKGDGRIFLWPITRTIRVRTFESDEKAI